MGLVGLALLVRRSRVLLVRLGHGSPTHSSVPSANCWCFQMGTVPLSVSIRSRHASNASPRCGAETAATTARSPISRCPTRWTRSEARDVVAAGDLAAYPLQRLDHAGVGRVVERRHGRTVVVVTHDADEQRDAPALGVLHEREHLVDAQRRRRGRR